jgi:sodium/pantothenate symporter
MPDSAPSPGYGVLAALFVVIAVSVWLGALAERAVERGSFLKGYFLGNRGLGVWALALTATVQSGGTFMGFPSLVYSHGWIVALWIGGYIVVPLTGFAVLGKRIAHLSRRTGAITVPDLFRARFASPAVGLAASIVIMLFMTFMLVAQFKAGAVVMKIAWPDSGILALPDETASGQPLDTGYYVGLAVFSATVIGYTLIGGFLASVWTDLFQSVLMFFGVVLLAVLIIPKVGGLQMATEAAVDATTPKYAAGPGYSTDGREFLPLGLAISMFFIWPLSGMASPAGLVRFMATKSTATIRRSIVVLSIYNMFIYLPIIAIAIAARTYMPNLEKSDEVIPRMALWGTEGLPGGSLMAGLILAAPFGAVMATVSTYLVVIASGLVRDVYQRFLHPQASERRIRIVSYLATLSVGLVAVVANIEPVQYLQALVVFSTSGTGACLLVPTVMACYWRRATAAGVLTAMFCGGATVLTLLINGLQSPDPMIGARTDFRPYFLLGVEPFVWGLVASAMTGVVVSLLTRPPQQMVLHQMFDILPSPTSASSAVQTQPD